jgi:hypothetical protein
VEYLEKIDGTLAPFGGRLSCTAAILRCWKAGGRATDVLVATR